MTTWACALHFPNELESLFSKCRSFAEEIQKIIKMTKNKKSCFAFASFKVHDDQTINSHAIYNFFAGGQAHDKMNMIFHPTQTTKRNWNGCSLDRCIFYAVNERFKHLRIHKLRSIQTKIRMHVRRHQFPVRPVFAANIYAAQGQIFEFIDVYLPISLFVLGMFYVDFSKTYKQKSL